MNRQLLFATLLATGIALASNAGTAQAQAKAQVPQAQAKKPAAKTELAQGRPQHAQGKTEAQGPAKKAEAKTEVAQVPTEPAQTTTEEAKEPTSGDAKKEEEAKLQSVPGSKALGMSILGNQEAPKALVIVPWKSSELGRSPGLSAILDDSRQPVDKDVFMRALRYYEIRSEKKP